MGILCQRHRRIRKKRVKSGGAKGGNLRDLYAALFKAAQMPPDEVARQSPRLLFCMLEGLKEDEEPDYESMSNEMKMFYGY